MPVRMRLLYVLNSLAVGGTERQVLALGDRMAARGHAVALMVLLPQEADGCITVLDVVYLDIQKDFASVITGVRRGELSYAASSPTSSTVITSMGICWPGG
jgi:hypothetical protein